MFSHLRVVLIIVLHLHLEDFRKPRIVIVVHLNANHAAPLAAATEENINRVGVVARVPTEPEFRRFLSDCRPQELERVGG